MESFKKFFQALSYLQYPLMLLAVFFSIKPYFNGFDYIIKNISVLLENYNYTLIFLGLGISFSTLQDTSKMQNKLSKKVWENPKMGKRFIILTCCLIGLFLSYGIFGYFITENAQLKEVSFGAIVFAIGLIGLLKTMLEVFENHRKDKNTTTKEE